MPPAWCSTASIPARQMLGGVLAVYRMLGQQGEVAHLIAGRLRDLTPLLGNLVTQSRDLRGARFAGVGTVAAIDTMEPLARARSGGQ
jgi:hypothetical protein